MKRIELGLPSAAATADDRRQAPAFRINTAIKIIPKFNEHDVESFLLSLKKTVQLNQFPEDKYVSILQAQLTGKALKVMVDFLLVLIELFSLRATTGATSKYRLKIGIFARMKSV